MFYSSHSVSADYVSFYAVVSACFVDSGRIPLEYIYVIYRSGRFFFTQACFTSGE